MHAFRQVVLQQKKSRAQEIVLLQDTLIHWDMVNFFKKLKLVSCDQKKRDEFTQEVPLRGGGIRLGNGGVDGKSRDGVAMRSPSCRSWAR